MQWTVKAEARQLSLYRSSTRNDAQRDIHLPILSVRLSVQRWLLCLSNVSKRVNTLLHFSRPRMQGSK